MAGEQRAEALKRNARSRKGGLAKAERVMQELDLRRQGLSLREIAKRVGVSHEQVRQDIAKYIEAAVERATELAQEVLVLDLERTDELLEVAMRQAKAGDKGAIETARRLIETRARLVQGLKGVNERQSLRLERGRSVTAVNIFLTTMSESGEINTGGNGHAVPVIDAEYKEYEVEVGEEEKGEEEGEA